MALTIGLVKESNPGETRIASVPDVMKKLCTQGVNFIIESNAGIDSAISDDDLMLISSDQINIKSSAKDVLTNSDILLKVQAPSIEEIQSMKDGSVLVGFLQPYASKERLDAINAKNITAISVELIPRISRAQSMDALSSQAAVSGYQSVLIAAGSCPKFFPMLTYAAGTIRPSRVLIIGAGVAGLQAIATAKRLGAIVEAYDVRPETKEQIESLGAKFVDTGVSAAGAGGYARELTEEEISQQAEKLAKAVAQADVLITTAAIPGKKSPLIISKSMIAGMKNGAIVVDMAAEGGGNCAGTKAGESIQVGNVIIIGPVNLPAKMPVHASEMYAKNLFNLLSPFIKDGELVFDWEDEVINGACLTREGKTVHEGVKKALGLE